MIEITLNKGFRMKFKNGMEISVQFGQGNYCDNYMHRIRNFGDAVPASSNAEIAVFDKNGKFVTKDIAKKHFKEDLYDDVAGRVSVDEIAHWIYVVQQEE